MRRISLKARREVLRALAQRYHNSDRAGKIRTVDKLVAITGYHRKHAIRLLAKANPASTINTTKPGRRIYDDAVKEVIVIIWEAADRICGRRLKAIIPQFVESMEHNGHLSLDPEVREKVITVSAATIDRMLQPVRIHARGKKKRRPQADTLIKRLVPVRTFSEWKDVQPGFCEADFVVHCGSVNSGSCVHSFVVTDVASGWTECLPLVARQKDLVVEALDVVRKQMPIKLLGINTDNDSAFLNEVLIKHCRKRKIEFTRSRAYRKNDQAWIEQKNGAVVRRLVGYSRFTGLVATHTLGRLYQLNRLYVNYFQPSFKLRTKTRHGVKVTKTYYKPATPCDRLLENASVSPKMKRRLIKQREKLDPVRLLHGIRELQETLSGLARLPGSPNSDSPACQDLDTFLAALPRLWRSGEARPTHRAKQKKRRNYRNRPDPFEGYWPTVLGWLQDEPEAAAKDLFLRLQSENPGVFASGQLRTLQRRVRDWRHAMARELIYVGTGNTEKSDKLMVL